MSTSGRRRNGHLLHLNYLQSLLKTLRPETPAARARIAEIYTNIERLQNRIANGY